MSIGEHWPTNTMVRHTRVPLQVLRGLEPNTPWGLCLGPEMGLR